MEKSIHDGMAILTWISFIIALIDLFPLYKTVEPLLAILNGQGITITYEYNSYYPILFVVLFVVLIVAFSLRKIAKKETRYPLMHNYAVSGYGKRITIEKVYVSKCPKCNGEMKYYNKPVEWRYYVDNGDQIKPEIIKRVPVLECRRNPEHFYHVDPAEQRTE